MAERVERRKATIVGVLYVVGTLAGVASLAVAGSLLGRPVDLPGIAADHVRIEIGAAFVLVMGLSLAMVPAVLFPLFRRFNEPLAVGAVIFRGGLEAVAYLATAGIWLVLIDVAERAAAAGATGVQQAFGQTLLDANDVVSDILLPIVFSIGALMIYWIFFTSGLIPRWLSVWGLVGAVLFLTAALLSMFDVSWGFLMAPLAVQEMVMAVWLIARGFSVPMVRGAHKARAAIAPGESVAAVDGFGRQESSPR